MRLPEEEKLPFLENPIIPEDLKQLHREYSQYLNVKNYSKHTVLAYTKDIEDFWTFLVKESLPYLDLQMVDIRSYFSNMQTLQNMEKLSQRRKLSSIRCAYRYMFRVGKIAQNQSLEIRFPKAKKKLPKYIKPQVLEKTLDFSNRQSIYAASSSFTNKRDKAILEMLYSSGMRVMEIANAEMGQLSNDCSELKIVGKGNRERIVFIGEEAKKSLQEYLDERTKKEVTTSKIFCNARGDQLTTRGIHFILNGRKLELGLEDNLSPHKFRHTFATDLLNSGAGIREVQELLGHKSIASTQIYLTVSQEKLREVYRKSHPHAKK